MLRYCSKCSAETERYVTGRCKPCARASARAWQALNPDKKAGYDKAFRLANPGYFGPLNKAWYAANKERVDERNRAWRAAHPEKLYAMQHKQRVRVAGGTQEATALAFLQWMKSTNDPLHCFYCSALLEDSGPSQRTVDHVFGLRAGNTLGNLETACFSCNSSKQDMAYEDFIAGLGHRFTGDTRSKDQFLQALGLAS
jgi:5-methylcytosine-specific restriction endonuclease McrA